MRSYNWYTLRYTEKKLNQIKTNKYISLQFLFNSRQPKFFEDDSRVICRSPESPQGVSFAGFFVSSICLAKSEENYSNPPFKHLVRHLKKLHYFSDIRKCRSPATVRKTYLYPLRILTLNDFTRHTKLKHWI